MAERSYKAFCVVKYKSEYYSEKGHYTKDEWTDYSDVGKCFDGQILTLEEYVKVEEAYISSIMCLVRAVNAKRFKMFNLSKLRENNIDEFIRKNDEALFEACTFLRSNKYFDIESMLRQFLKIVLRNYASFDIKFDDKFESRIFFGWDYYMYFDSNYNLLLLYNEIKNLGLHPRLR